MIRNHFVRRALRAGITCAYAMLGGWSMAQAPARPSSINTASIPADRMAETWWAARHAAVLEEVHKNPDAQLLLIGDSIIQNYEKVKLPDENFQPTWNEFYKPRGAINLGFSGDTTANVLWRIDHGEVDGVHPKAVVLLIGANNTGHQGESAKQTEGGIDAVIADLERRLPQTNILLIGILPSNISAHKTEEDAAVNRYLAACYGENPRVTYLDISSIFYRANNLNSSIYYDPRLTPSRGALHPDTNGQRMMAEAIEPTLAKMMNEETVVPLASMTDINTALIPVPKLEQDSYDWYARHHAEIELQKTLDPQVVLIGDSITHFWGGQNPSSNHINGPNAWERVFSGLRTMNMGFGWDRTQNVLWRLRQGEFEGINPYWVVLLIGTNNLTGTANARANTPQEIAEGIDAICRVIHERSPRSHIVLMAILPRGEQPGSPFRQPIQETNQLLAQRYAVDASVTYLDIGTKLLAPDGSLPAKLIPGGTHPSDAGYQIWADALMQAGIER